MDNPNQLNCLMLTRNALPIFSSLFSPIFLSSSPSSIFPPLYLLPYIYLSLSYSIPLSFFFPLSLFLFTSLFLLSSLSSPPSHPPPLIFFPSSISPLFFSPCYKHSLSNLCCMTFLILSLPLPLYSFLAFLPLPLFLHPSPISLPLYAFLLHI